jgi:hypothetical protein
VEATAGRRFCGMLDACPPPRLTTGVMPETPYKREVEIVQRAIARLRSETDSRLIAELESEQLAAGTGLEWYGITKGVFERFLASRVLSDALSCGIWDCCSDTTEVTSGWSQPPMALSVPLRGRHRRPAVAHPDRRRLRP